MKSRISIDVDYDNQPIIRIEYSPSEDVRDKLVKRFMETFGGDSYFATFFYVNSTLDMGQNRDAVIRPLPVREMSSHVENFQTIIEKAGRLNMVMGSYPLEADSESSPKEQ